MTLPRLTVNTTLMVAGQPYVIGSLEGRFDASGRDRALIPVTNGEASLWIEPESRSEMLRAWPNVGPLALGSSQRGAPAWLFLLPDRTLTDGQAWVQWFGAEEHNATAHMRPQAITIELEGRHSEYHATYHFDGPFHWQNLTRLQIDAIRDDRNPLENQTHAISVVLDPRGYTHRLGPGVPQVPDKVAPAAWPMYAPDEPFALPLDQSLNRLEKEDAYMHYVASRDSWPHTIYYRDTGPYSSFMPMWSFWIVDGSPQALTAEVHGVQGALPVQPVLLARSEVSGAGLSASRPPMASLGTMMDIAETLHGDVGDRHVTNLELRSSLALILYGRGEDARYCYLDPERGVALECDRGPTRCYTGAARGAAETCPVRPPPRH